MNLPKKMQYSVFQYTAAMIAAKDLLMDARQNVLPTQQEFTGAIAAPCSLA
jgi:hypothetical protein